MERIGVGEHGPDGVGDHLADRGLARAGDAHHDDSTARAHGRGHSIVDKPTSPPARGSEKSGDSAAAFDGAIIHHPLSLPAPCRPEAPSGACTTGWDQSIEIAWVGHWLTAAL